MSAAPKINPFKNAMDRAYTARWYLTETINSALAGDLDKAIKLLEESKSIDNEVLAMLHQLRTATPPAVAAPSPSEPAIVPPPPVALAGKDRLKLVYARTDIKMKAQGRFEAGGPRGAVIHFSAGHFRTTQNVIDFMRDAANRGLGFHAIALDGTFFQGLDLNQIGSHAGESYWPGIGYSVSRELLGIEVANGGTVDSKNKTWFGTTLLPEDIRCSKQNANIAPGCYHKIAEAQKNTLIRVLCDLKDLYPETFRFENIVGHDEVAGPRGLGLVNAKYRNSWRKTDPGAMLPTNMDLFRDEVRRAYALRKQG